MRTATLLGLSASAAYAFAGMGGDPGLFPSAQAQEPVRGGTLRLALRLGDIRDPHTYSWGQGEFMRQTLEHLTLTGIDNVTRPLLPESWEPSADLKTWTLRIRRDVTWHSGRPLVADDVIWNLKRALDPATGSATVVLMAGYMLERYDTGEKEDNVQAIFGRRLWDANAIEKVDDHTVRLNARVPILAVPEHLYHHQLFMLDPDDGGEFKIGANFTGPCQIVSYEQGKRAVRTARANDWGGAPHVETLELLDLGDNASPAMAALAADQIDGWPSVDNSSLQAIRTLDGVNVYGAHTREHRCGTSTPRGETLRRSPPAQGDAARHRRPVGSRPRTRWSGYRGRTSPRLQDPSRRWARTSSALRSRCRKETVGRGRRSERHRCGGRSEIFPGLGESVGSVHSHDPGIVRYLADRVIVMHAGEIVEIGPVDAVFAPPYHPYTESLLAAVPVVDTESGQRRIKLQGEAPSLLVQASGCGLASRCPRKLAGDLCDRVAPPLREVAKGHAIRCHIPVETLRSVPPVFVPAPQESRAAPRPPENPAP